MRNHTRHGSRTHRYFSDEWSDHPSDLMTCFGVNSDRVIRRRDVTDRVDDRVNHRYRDGSLSRVDE